jgi:catechol 2,3-dioxygenase-like lactoylglutathione lyase family enzyme
MFQGLRTTIYHVPDLAAAKEWYVSLLGVPPYFDEPFYVGFNVGGFELGLAPCETSDPEGESERTLTYWGVPDADTALDRLLTSGATVREPVTDVGDGIKVASVISPSGNIVGIIENPHFVLP